MNLYQIHAIVVPAPVKGWNSSGRQIPTFWLGSVDADAAAKTAARVLRSANPSAERIDVTAYRDHDGTEEWGTTLDEN